MKTLLFLILLAILNSCCHKDHKIKSHFDFIEVTYYNGWTGGSTVRIDSSGVIQKCKYYIISHIDSALCCIDTLDSKYIDSINIKIDKLKKEKIDSIYDGHCEDCGCFIIKIKFDNKVIRSIIDDLDRFDSNILNLAKYVTRIKIDKNKLDSIIVFETTKAMIPPPLNPKVKFIPPDIGRK